MAVGTAAVRCARTLHRHSSCTCTERPHTTAAAEVYSVCCARRAQADNLPARYGGTAPTPPPQNQQQLQQLRRPPPKKTNFFRSALVPAQYAGKFSNNKYHSVLTITLLNIIFRQPHNAYLLNTYVLLNLVMSRKQYGFANISNGC